MVGSGSQDIDFKDRVLKLAVGTGEQEPLRRLPQQDIGICLANPTNKNMDWSQVKIRNCNPEDIKRLENWGRFNGENCRIFAKKMKGGNMVRNQRKFGAAFRPRPSPHHVDVCHSTHVLATNFQHRHERTHTRTNTQAHRQALDALLESFFRLGERACMRHSTPSTVPSQLPQ